MKPATEDSQKERTRQENSNKLLCNYSRSHRYCFSILSRQNIQEYMCILDKNKEPHACPRSIHFEHLFSSLTSRALPMKYLRKQAKRVD